MLRKIFPTTVGITRISRILVATGPQDPTAFLTQSSKGPRGSEQCQNDFTVENFVHKTAVSQIDLKWWSKKGDLDHFYVDSVMQD